MDEAAALAALQDSSPDGEVTPAPQTTTAQPEVNQAPTQTATPDAESFTQIDPTTLPPELQATYKSMLADYTRKTQDVAAVRKAFDGVEMDDYQAAREAYDFYQNLNSDADFAKDIYAQLGEALKPFQDNPNAEIVSDPDLDVDPTDAKLSELDARIKNFEEMQRFQAGAAELQRQEMALRSQHDNWKDSDFEAVYEIAQAYDGNLLQAGQRYDALKNAVIAEYLSSKADVNPALAPVTTGLNGSEPLSAPQDTREAHLRALEYMMQQDGQ